jgi:RNA polymerase subunit RPABC4/transcription elongation factor Spt4
MKKCTNCDRSLLDGEKDLCPSCFSKNNHNTKRWTEFIGGALVIAATIGMSLLTSNKDGQDDS